MLFVDSLDRCIQDGGGSELHITRFRAAGSLLQLQDSHIVGCSCAEDVGRDKKCHLRASGWPVTSQVESVDPDLSLNEKQTNKQINKSTGYWLNLKNTCFIQTHQRSSVSFIHTLCTFRAGLQLDSFIYSYTVYS